MKIVGAPSGDSGQALAQPQQPGDPWELPSTPEAVQLWIMLPEYVDLTMITLTLRNINATRYMDVLVGKYLDDMDIALQVSPPS